MSGRRQREAPLRVAERYIHKEDPPWVEERFVSEFKGKLDLQLLLLLGTAKPLACEKLISHY